MDGLRQKEQRASGWMNWRRGNKQAKSRAELHQHAFFLFPSVDDREDHLATSQPASTTADVSARF